MNPDGMILLKKPEGVTSFQALNILKKKLKTKKIGHTGTLDKFATGLLVILTGKMTKFAPFITGMDKTYLATFRFGTTTTTLDPEGDFLGNKDIPTLQKIKEIIKSNFIGNISQRPPDFSAIHIGGQRAYQLKLQGKDFTIPERIITINKFEVLDWDGRDLNVEISCSKGTYIRSIARDLGVLTDSLAYVVKLHRSKVGPFSDNESVSGDDFILTNLVNPYDLIYNLNKQIAYVKEDSKRSIKDGKKLLVDYLSTNIKELNNGEIALFDDKKEFIAMVDYDGLTFKYLFVSN